MPLAFGDMPVGKLQVIQDRCSVHIGTHERARLLCSVALAFKAGGADWVAVCAL